MEVIVRWSATHAKLIVGVIALAACLASFQIRYIHLTLDARSLIPAQDPGLATSDESAARFHQEDRIVLGIQPKMGDIYTPATLAALHEITSGLKSAAYVERGSVLSLANLPRLSVENGVLDPRPLLARRNVDWQVVHLLRKETQSFQLNDGILLSRDGRMAVAYADVRPGSNSTAVTEAVNRLVRLANRRATDDVIMATGTPLAQAELGVASFQDLIRLVPFVVCALAVILVLFFRGFRAGLISIVEVGISLLLTMGIMGLTRQTVFITTLVLPVILITVGIADDIYALRSFYAEVALGEYRTRTGLIVAAFSKIQSQILMTAASTIVGLLSFAITNVRPMRVFGVFGALAIFLSTIMTFTLVPAMLALQRPAMPAARAGVVLRRRCASLYERFRSVGPATTLLLVALLGCAAAVVAQRVRIDDSWIANLPAGSPVVVADTAMNRYMGGTTELDFDVAGDEKSDFLEPHSLRRLARLEEALRAEGSVGAVYSFYTAVSRVQAALRSEPLPLVKTVPLDASSIAEAHLFLSLSPQIQLSHWLSDDRKHAKVAAFIRSADYTQIAAILQRARDSAKGEGFASSVSPFGDGWISYFTVNSLVAGQRSSTGLAFLIDGLLLTILFRSPRAAILALIPVAFGMLLVLALMALLHIPLGIANSMFIAIVIGIGTDFSVHLTTSLRLRLRSGEPAADVCRDVVPEAAHAIFTSVVTLGIGFAVLGLSNVRPNRELAFSICVGLAACALSTLVIVPNLVLVFSRTIKYETLESSTNNVSHEYVQRS